MELMLYTGLLEDALAKQTLHIVSKGLQHSIYSTAERKFV